MTIYTKNSGTWNQVTQPYVKQGGVWYLCKEVWTKNSGTWNKVWPDSDPQTYTWYCNWSQGYRADGPKLTSDIFSGDSTSDLIQGFWENMPPVGAGFTTSLIGFDDADIRSKLAVRPVITKVRLRLTVKLDYNSQGTRCRIHTANYASEPSSFTYGSFIAAVYTDATKRAENVNVWHTLPNSVGNDFRDNNIKALGLYEQSRSESESTKTEYRGTWYGVAAGTGSRPQLEITCDYT